MPSFANLDDKMQQGANEGITADLIHQGTREIIPWDRKFGEDLLPPVFPYPDATSLFSLYLLHSFLSKIPVILGHNLLNVYTQILVVYEIIIFYGNERKPGSLKVLRIWKYEKTKQKESKISSKEKWGPIYIKVTLCPFSWTETWLGVLTSSNFAIILWESLES